MDDIQSGLHAVAVWQSRDKKFAISFSCGSVELSGYEDINQAIAQCDKLRDPSKNKGRWRTIIADVDSNVLVSPLQIA